MCGLKAVLFIKVAFKVLIGVAPACVLLVGLSSGMCTVYFVTGLLPEFTVFYCLKIVLLFLFGLIIGNFRFTLPSFMALASEIIAPLSILGVVLKSG